MEVKKKTWSTKSQGNYTNCPVCDKKVTVKTLRYHIKYAADKLGDQAHIDYRGAKKYKCPCCYFSTDFSNGIGSHIQQQKANNKSHAAFYEKQVLLVQELGNKGLSSVKISKSEGIFFGPTWISEIIRDNTGSIECEACHKKFKDLDGLKSHVAKTHDENHFNLSKTLDWNQHWAEYRKIEKCPICDHRSNWTTKHMRQQLDVVKDPIHLEWARINYVECPICSKLYSSSDGSLMKHISKMDDKEHKNYVQLQKEKIWQFVESGQVIDYICKCEDILYKDFESIREIILEKYSPDVLQANLLKNRSECRKEYNSRPGIREKVSLRMRGENSPSWKGGHSEYRGENWNSARLAARKRDSYICVSCNTTKEQNGRAMSVHHIIPYKEFNNCIEANKLDNLISLCDSCHSSIERQYYDPTLKLQVQGELRALLKK